jgi:methylmalonyl-CoA mutase, C-terminal domain
MSSERKIRVLLAKPGLDGHERGARVVAFGLRDEGFEVIYTGLRQTADQIAVAAIQEDVEVVGLSILSGAHLSLTQKVLDSLKTHGAEGIAVLVGGVIPEQDIPELKRMGVAEVFTAGTPISKIAAVIRSMAAATPREATGR